MYLQKVTNNITVLRDDLLEGGSKTRFLPYLIKGADEIVFAGPFCGGAPLALSVLGRQSGQKITLFYAKRKLWHRKQLAAKKNGANIIEVTPGYMTVNQSRARTYAKEAGALFLPLGFDVPAAEEPFVEFMEKVRKKIDKVDQVWCCAGSGMLARCLGNAFPESEICAVAIGLASRHEAQSFDSNIRMIKSRYRFEQETRAECPFPSCANYDRKAWEVCAKEAKGKILFWNVSS
jgi:1-aminocyclopropane-1-carboxylate deaminase/D-cysteine desulfhydrase-like pyridoxal-dependent ACC family enzyme